MALHCVEKNEIFTWNEIFIPLLFVTSLLILVMLLSEFTSAVEEDAAGGTAIVQVY